MNGQPAPSPTSSPAAETVIGLAQVAGAVALNVFAPGLGTVGTMILQYGIQYGPDAARSLIALFKKGDLTLQDLDGYFAALKPYSAYGIPDKVPVKAP